MTGCQGTRLPIHRWACVNSLDNQSAFAQWTLHAFAASLVCVYPAAAEVHHCLGAALTCLKLLAPDACMSALCPDLKGWHCSTHPLQAPSSCCCRQLSHRSFTTPKWVEYALAYCGVLAVQASAACGFLMCKTMAHYCCSCRLDWGIALG